MVASPRASATGFSPAPPTWDDELEHRRKLAETANLALAGKTNNISTFTLAASVATTTVVDRRVTPNSIILWMPTTANAGGEMGVYITSVGALSGGIPSFVVNHGVDSRTDRTFKYAVFG